MSGTKKTKNEKIQQQERHKTKGQKKSKSKKKKKQLMNGQQKVQQVKRTKGKQVNRDSGSKGKQHSNHSASTPSQQQMQFLCGQLSLLQPSSSLLPSQQLSSLISSNLQRLTLNLLQTMIISSNLLTNTIRLARQSRLTLKQYFFINYTNKLIVINHLLEINSARKYLKWIKIIDKQVDRVEGMVLLSLENVKMYQEVLGDLMRNNVEWEVANQYQIADKNASGNKD